MPLRRTAAQGIVGVALLVAANVAVYQRRQAGPLWASSPQVQGLASSLAASDTVATGVLEHEPSPLPLQVEPLLRPPSPPPPPPPPPQPAPPPPQSRLPPPPSTLSSSPETTTTVTPKSFARPSDNGCPAGMQSATDPALADDPSTDCKKLHVFANGIHACYDHVRVQQGRYSRVNLHEPSEEELLARALALIRPGDVFVDVGAAVGYYTLLVASTHPESVVFGFNPSEWFRKQMAHNIRINFAGQAGSPGGTVICIEPRSLGMVDGSLSYVNGEFGGRVREAGVGGIAVDHVDISTGVRDITESTTVKMSTWMETTLGSGREVWMMMIDIQGTEGKVIRGAQADGLLSKGLVRQFFIGIHSGNNLENIRMDLQNAGYDILYDEAKVDKLSPDGLLWAVFKDWDRYDEIKALSTSVVPIENLIVKGDSGTVCGAKEGKDGCVHRNGCCVPWAASLPIE